MSHILALGTGYWLRIFIDLMVWSGCCLFLSLTAQGLVPVAAAVVPFVRNSRGLSHHYDGNCSRRAVVRVPTGGCLLPDLLPEMALRAIELTWRARIIDTPA